jgi:hypothetical protein
MTGYPERKRPIYLFRDDPGSVIVPPLKDLCGDQLRAAPYGSNVVSQ